MENNFVDIKTELSALTVEMKHLTQTVSKLEKIIEITNTLSRDLSLISERVKTLEDDGRTSRIKIRKLEDWRLTIMAWAGAVGWIVSFIISKIL